MTRLCSGRALANDTRGAHLVEYVVIVGLVSLAALGGFRVFGARVSGTANAHADRVATLSGTDPNAAAIGGVLEKAAGGVFAVAEAPGAPAPEAPAAGTHYTLKSDVTLSDDIKTKVGTLADAYNKATSKDLTVTSGSRDASEQASAMYTKLELGDDLLALYANDDAVQEIIDAYDAANKGKKTKDQTVADMTAVIQKQVDDGTYISKHLRDGAVDFRSSDMTEDQKKAFRKAVEDMGAKLIEEGTPPHFHVEF